MRMGVLALSAAAMFGLGVLAAGSAQAGPLMPGTAAAAEAMVPAGAENVRWVCRGNSCRWDPRFRGPVPPYARGWGPPRHSWCYWTQVRGPGGRWHWVQRCRR